MVQNGTCTPMPRSALQSLALLGGRGNALLAQTHVSPHRPCLRVMATAARLSCAGQGLHGLPDSPSKTLTAPSAATPREPPALRALGWGLLPPLAEFTNSVLAASQAVSCPVTSIFPLRSVIPSAILHGTYSLGLGLDSEWALCHHSQTGSTHTLDGAHTHLLRAPTQPDGAHAHPLRVTGGSQSRCRCYLWKRRPSLSLSPGLRGIGNDLHNKIRFRC